MNTKTNTTTENATETKETNMNPIKITKRNRNKIAQELHERFPAVGSLERVIELIADAKDSHAAEDAIEAALDAQSKGSVVPASYKARYAARGNPANCGDDFAHEFESVISTTNGKGKKMVDMEALREIAERNGIGNWFDHYVTKDLNNGMVRMNIGNRLRARIKKGEKLEYWPTKVSFAK